MKIICIGFNYGKHTDELQLIERPAEPVIFMKPDSALLRGGNPFFPADWANEWEYETELVVKICKLGRYIDRKFAHRYYQEVGLGIDFTARDLQRRLSAEGKPWECCKAFDGSAAICDRWLNKDSLGDIKTLHFRLEINGETRQNGHTADMLWSVDEIIEYVSRFFTLKTGDLIFTGTPAGVGQVRIGDNLKGFLKDEEILNVKVR